MMLTNAQLKKMTANAARDLYQIGKISQFEMRLRDFMHGEVSLPIYTPADVRRMRQELGLSQNAMAELFGVKDKTILRWERDGENIPGPVCIALCLLDKCRDSFFDLFDPRRTSLTLSDTKKNSLFQNNSASESQNTALGTIGNPFDNSKLENRRTEMPGTFDGATIFHLRERLNISKRDLADMLDVSESTIIKWETDCIVPKGPALILLKSLWLYGFDALPE